MEYIDTKQKNVLVIGKLHRVKFLKKEEGEKLLVSYGDATEVSGPIYLHMIMDRLKDDDVKEVHVLFQEPYRRIIDLLRVFLSNNDSNFKLTECKLDKVESINKKTNQRILTNRCTFKKVSLLE